MRAANRRWHEFTGLSDAAALGLAAFSAIHPDDRADAERTLRAANEARTVFRFEHRMRRADGEYRWVLAAASVRL
jgi:PAS domain S-box-containing protein